MQQTKKNSYVCQHDWLNCTLGQYLLAREQAMYDTVVGDIFGFNALQLGLLQMDALKNSRIPHLLHVGNNDGDAYCESDYLPFAESCIDLICLPHVLEFSGNPHQTLREAERVLVPEGYLILTGFNPVSAWGLRQVLIKDNNYPWHGHFFTLSRIKDWLALLGLEFVSGSMNCYEPPINDEKWLNRFTFMDEMGDKWWPMMGGLYFIVAKKRVVNMTLLKPNWKKNSIKSKLAVSSNPKSKPHQQKKQTMNQLVEVYADGACKGNPGPGGWGAWLHYDGKHKSLHGGEAFTTNNRMELTAVIRALEALKRPCNVKIYTDSVYVQKGISEWIIGWKARNWRTADKKPVKNDDLWKTLDLLANQHSVEWVWVKGHAGNAGNERADELANQGVAAFL